MDLPTLDATLDDAVPLAQSLGYHVRQLSESWQNAMYQVHEANGVTPAQWRYLRELWEEDGLSQRELGERAGRQGPTIVTALRSLERSGYVRVEKVAHDRRRTSIYLTERGRRLKDELAPLIRATEQMVLAGLSESEIRTFKRTIVAIQNNLDAHNRNRYSWSRWRTEQLAKEVEDERAT